MYKKYVTYFLFFLIGLITTYIFNESNVDTIYKPTIFLKTDTIFLNENKVINRNEYLVYQYIERFKKIAIFEYGKYNILPSIKLAQGILESKYGKSYLCKKTNNHFGIKCFGDCDDINSIVMEDDNPNDRFKKYSSPWESYRDHSILLQKNRYDNCLKCGKDYKCWALNLKKSGYATSKKYTEKIINIIEKYELYNYD